MAETPGGLNPQDMLNKEPNYWRSLKELYGDPDFVEASHHEFKEGVTDPFDPDNLSGMSRRKFLALLGASAALAGAGCSDYRDKGEIIPYNHKPEEIIPGKANFYASTCTSCANACGLLIKTREGRPIKVDGNPDHPVNKGKICAKGQASILNLYDPERLQAPLKKGDGGFNPISWDDVDYEVMNELGKASGKEIAVVTGKILSPTTIKLLDDFRNKYPSVRHYFYEAFNESERTNAWGSDNVPFIKWNEAKVMVALEADFLGNEGNKVENVRLFGEGRNVDDIKNFNRLYAVEGNMSITGMNADYRFKLRPDAQYEFVMGLLNTFTGTRGYSLTSVAMRYRLNLNKLDTLVTDLQENRGSAIVYAGRTLSAKVHTAVNLLNEAIGAANLYRTDSTPVALHSLSTKEELGDLVNRMHNGELAAVIHFDTNPLYHLAPDYGYAKALKKVPLVVTMTEQENETSALSHYVLPVNHNFESWGDAKTRTGLYSLQQPVIYPIFKTRQKESVILQWIHGKSGSFNTENYYNYLVKNWRDNIHPSTGSKVSFKQFWASALHDGIVTVNEPAVTDERPNDFIPQEKVPEVTGYAVVLKESYKVGDGRFANNGWLQELPHPVSKIVWDNYASVSFNTAQEFNLESNDVVEITIGNKKLNIPVFIQPGAADDTFTIEMGYGREKIGLVGSGTGFNAGLLQSKDFALSPWLYSGALVRRTGEKYNLATAQEHHSFEDTRTKDAAIKRGIIREGTVELYEKKPEFLHEGKEEELNTLYGEHLTTMYSGLKWGMAIDMNKCLGCGECVIACQSENNIPVVGKEQVGKGREMHWLRIDRYYSGTPEDPAVHNQPMLCQHCDHAPCENVCPVVATTHSNDGLNQMVYNRCVGTRYCSNNCPYKVRRFNYFNFRDHFKDNYQESAVFSLLYNPEVTVRSRGVMEKCTFCIQRIMEAREDAIREKRPLKGTDVTTACQDACNANAITFGDINDSDAKLSEKRKHKLGYYVLEELNTRPNVTYLARLRNTHSEGNID